jgi:hypothetical protein
MACFYQSGMRIKDGVDRVVYNVETYNFQNSYLRYRKCEKRGKRMEKK